MKKGLYSAIAFYGAMCLSAPLLFAQDASKFQEPGTGALKQVKTAVQEAQEAEKPKEKKEEPPSAPLNTSVGSTKQTVSQMTSGPEVTWVHRSKPDAPKSLFDRSIAERLQARTVQAPVSNPPAADNAPSDLSQEGAVTDGVLAPETSSPGSSVVDLSAADTVSAPSLPVLVDTTSSVSTSTDSPVVSDNVTSSESASGPVTQSANTSVTDKPSSQPETAAPSISGLDQKTLDLLPAAVFEASMESAAQTGTFTLAGPGAAPAPKDAEAVKAEMDAQNARGAGTGEESARRLGQRGTAVEKLAGSASKGGSGKSGLLAGSQSAQTGWFDALRARVDRNNVSDMKEREGESDQMCVSFADTDGITQMIEKSAEKAGLSEDHPRILYAYGHDKDNIVFITVIQLDSSGELRKAARLFADGRVQAFGQLAKEDLAGMMFRGEPVPPTEVLFAKATYRITGVLQSETMSQFFLDQSRGAARGPCPKPFSKK